MQINLIANALEYYDLHNQKYEKLLNNAVRLEVDTKLGDLNSPQITLFDKNDKELLTAEYQYIGMYYKLFDIWVWAWGHSLYDKNATKLSRKILEYGLDLRPNNILNGILRAQLITSRFKIQKKAQLDIHLALAGYLTKQPIIYKYKNVLDNKNPNNYTIECYSLINIKVKK